MSDGGVIKCTDFYSRLITNILKLPEPNYIMGIPDKKSCVFRGDEEYATTPNYIHYKFYVPYRYSSNVGYEEKVFKYSTS